MYNKIICRWKGDWRLDTYNILVLIQSLSIVILSVGSIYLIGNWRGKEHTYLVLFCIATLINNVGSLVEIIECESEQILLGTKFAYVGKVFIPLTFFLFIMQYCEITIPRKVKILLTFFHLSIAIMVFSYPLQKWFYTDVEYSTEGLFPHNNYGHGVMYNVYTVSLVLYFVVISAVVITILARERRKKRRIQMYYMLACIVCAMAGFIIFLLGVTGGYDITSLAYAICTIFMAIALSKYDLIDTVELARNYVIDNLALGIIALDEDNRIIYFNEPLQGMYPDFRENGNAIVKTLISKSEKKTVVTIEDKVYKPEYKVLNSNGKDRGHILTLSDITDNYSYTQLMKKMTEIDSLTGLYNRFAYEYRISEMKKNGNWPENLILLAMDVNGLKAVNDSKGHDVGDAMIYDAAQCILRGVGSFGQCYRVGGDEFVALITQAGVEPEKIKQKIKAEAEACQREDYFVSVAVGYAIGQENTDKCLEDLEKLADKRMYQDKENFYISKGVNRRTKEENYRVLYDSYLKILKANLESGEFEIIKMDIMEKDATFGFSRNLQTWLRDFANCNMIYEDDIEMFLEKTNLHVLKEKFAKNNIQPVRIIYRRKVMDAYHKVMLEIVPGKEYSKDQPMVYLYVKDMGDEV